MDNKTTAIVAVLILVVAGAAVGITMMNNGGNNKNGGGAITVTDALGETYSFDKPLDKVVLGYSCSGGPFITMSALMGDDIVNHLVGIDNSLYKFRKDVYDAYCADVPGFSGLEQIGGIGSDLDPTYVASLGPQALITSIHHKSTVDSSKVGEKFSSVNIPTIYIDFISEDIEKHKASVELLGKLFGLEERAKQIIDFYDSKVTPITSKVDELLTANTIQRTPVYIEPMQFGSTDFGTSNGNNYLYGKIAYLCGADSICKTDSSKLDESYILAPATKFSSIFLQGSDWNNGTDYLNLGFNGTAAKAKETIKTVLENRENAKPGWADLDAVKDGKIYALNMGLSRDIWDFAAFEFTVKCLYPDQFTDVDYEKDLKAFFDTFLPVDFKGTWFYIYSE